MDKFPLLLSRHKNHSQYLQCPKAPAHGRHRLSGHRRNPLHTHRQQLFNFAHNVPSHKKARIQKICLHRLKNFRAPYPPPECLPERTQKIWNSGTARFYLHDKNHGFHRHSNGRKPALFRLQPQRRFTNRLHHHLLGHHSRNGHRRTGQEGHQRTKRRGSYRL